MATAPLTRGDGAIRLMLWKVVILLLTWKPVRKSFSRQKPWQAFRARLSHTEQRS